MLIMAVTSRSPLLLDRAVSVLQYKPCFQSNTLCEAIPPGSSLCEAIPPGSSLCKDRTMGWNETSIEQK